MREEEAIELICPINKENCIASKCAWWCVKKTMNYYIRGTSMWVTDENHSSLQEIQQLTGVEGRVEPDNFGAGYCQGGLVCSKTYSRGDE